MNDLMGSMSQIGERLRTQDNAATSHPLFVVFQKRRVYGVSSDYTNTFSWYRDDDDSDRQPLSGDEAEALELFWWNYHREPEGFMRLGYVEIEVYATACLTRAGAENYLAANGHNLKDPFIYVASAYRNQEMVEVREFLKSLGGE